jgi:hypothetical protein
MEQEALGHPLHGFWVNSRHPLLLVKVAQLGSGSDGWVTETKLMRLVSSWLWNKFELYPNWE